MKQTTNTDLRCESGALLTKLRSQRSHQLTGGLVSVGAPSNVILLVALDGARHLLHFADFRHAQFGVIVEEGAATLDG